jgi:F-type H+-transporting ATPase subunit b
MSSIMSARFRLVVGFVLFSALPLLAEESGAAPEQPSMLLWQVLNFVIIAGFIGWLAAKHGGPILAARSAGIKEGLAAGERAKVDADTRAAQVQKQLASLDKEVASMRAAAKEERDREAERIRRDAQTEIARIHFQAEHEVESAGKLARLDVQRAAAQLAIELAETKVRSRMSADIQTALLQGFLADLPRNGAVQKLG